MTSLLSDRFGPGASLTAQAEAQLARSGMRLAFPPELEARYRLDLASDRSCELRHITRTGALLYFSLGVLMKLSGVTHENWRDCITQLAGGSGGVLLLAHYFFKPTIADTLREISALVCCLVVSLAAILVAYLAPATTQDLIIAALPANFVLMFVRLRFHFAVVFALVSFGCYSLSVLLRPTLEPQTHVFLITFMAILCLPALVGVHSLERASRRLYLHGLLQNLRVARLAVENNMLTVLSMTDPLTKVANRRRLDMELRTFCAGVEKTGALLLIDVDRFKAFNDMHGHQAGDLCLQEVAERLAAHLRPSDLLARFGGEEFAVLLPGVPAREAACMAERLRTAIHARPFIAYGAEIRVTVSIGIATVNIDTTPETLLEAADLALYAAKSGGRNQVRV